MDYLIRETITECAPEALRSSGVPYVSVLTPAQWAARRESFDFGIDLEFDVREIRSTMAEVNCDSLTGTFSIPDRTALGEHSSCFAFVLDEKGVVFIDENGTAEEMVRSILRSKRWREPSLARFLYDFLERIVQGDLALMERYKLELGEIEDHIQDADADTDLTRLNEIRGDIRELEIHYEQLIDLGQELEENENGFFPEAHERFFHLFLNRMARLHDAAASLRDYIMQIRDLYHAQLDARQNRIMALLTVVTSIFLPLTLIAGWYGMNFRYMPELQWKWAYPVVIGVSVLIVVVCLWFFRKKKWL